MKPILFAFVLVSAGAAARPAACQDRPAAAAGKTSEPAHQALTIPEGAVADGPSTWKYTGKDGKKWIYRKTPMGVVRVEDTPEANKPAPGQAEQRTRHWKVTEQGDTVAFEASSPFGPQKWSRKKSELTGDEKYALERSRGAAAKPEEKD